MTHGALFNGIAGFPLAAQWAGIETLWTCEIDPFCNAVSKKHFPDAIQFKDIYDLKNPPYTDIISGGFPCQPFSQAGKRKGKEDDRHLWPEMLRIIKEVKPMWVIAENVIGIVRMELGQVLSDLEAIGYDFPRDSHGLPIVPVIPAAGINAPHKRDRAWIISYAGSMGREQGGSEESIRQQNDRRERIWGDIEGYCRSGNASHAPEFGREQSGDTWTRRTGFEDGNIYDKYALGPGCEERNISRFACEAGFDNRRYYGRISNWNQFPTQSPVCGRNDGIPNRVDRIKSLGNAIVPQVAYQIFKAIKEIETE